MSSTINPETGNIDLLGGDITIGTTAITGGTDTRVLFDDAGFIGEDAGFVYNKTTKELSLINGDNTVVVSGTAFTAQNDYDFIVPSDGLMRFKVGTTRYFEIDSSTGAYFRNGYEADGSVFLGTVGVTGHIEIDSLNGLLTFFDTGSGVNEEDIAINFRSATNQIAIQSSTGINKIQFTGISLIASGLTSSNLTSGRVPIVGTSGLIEDDAGLTYNKTTDVLSTQSLILGYDLNQAGISTPQDSSVFGLYIQTGNGTTKNSGLLAFYTGAGVGASHDSGGITFGTGDSVNANSGGIYLSTGAALSGTRGGIYFNGLSASPEVNDGLPLGTTSLKWSDLFLASGAVVNFNNGNVTLTHSAGFLTMAGTLVVTSPKIITNIKDTNGNVLLGITATGSAVNSLTLANQATGTDPSLTVVTADTNRGMGLVMAGTGGVNVTSTNVGPSTITHGLTVNNTSGSASTDAFKANGNGITLLQTDPTTNLVKGFIPIRAITRATAQTAANTSVATYTNAATDGSFEVSANVLVTTATLHSFTVTVDYTDEGNTARTATLPFSVLAGTFVTAITNASGAVPYEGLPIHIRCKASTAITIKTTGTFTTVTYNVEGRISQLS